MDAVTGTYPVIIRQQLVWGDMDAFGHINNTVYFRYFEDARIAYFERIRVIEYMHAHHIGPILASTRCDFRAPLTYPGIIRIAAAAHDIQEKNFTMAYTVYSEDLSKVAAEGDGLIVYYDYKAGRSCEIPEEIVSNIRKLESEKTTNSS